MVDFLFGGIGMVIGILALAFWLWMLIDLLTRRMADMKKLIWVLVLLFGNIIGAILYYFIVKRK